MDVHYQALLQLLRETVMRAHLALPENKQDEEWFDDPTMNIDFMQQIHKVLNLGDYEHHGEEHS